MDLREKKTVRNIQNAFLQLRAKKPLERITARELIELAEVGKSTFYLHYKDVYDVSEQMQKDIISKIVEESPGFDLLSTNPAQYAAEAFRAFLKHTDVTDILFSGRQYYVLASYLEQGMKESLFRKRPDLRNDLEINVWISFLVQGGFSAHVENNQRFGDEKVFEKISEITAKIPMPSVLLDNGEG